MSYQLILGDAIEMLQTLPSDSVQCAITSPPYFGLRDYGTATWEGGEPACDHVQTLNLKRDTSGGVGGGRDKGTRGEQPHSTSSVIQYRDTCRKCGARRVDQQIGLEPTLEAYVAKLVDVFREVRRVLHPSGVVFLNLGDSYNGSGGSGGDYGPGGLKEGQPKYPGRNVNGLGPKQLLGIPWRVAFALQADGWILRSEIIWHKRAPMPESVQDRPTKAHEQVFLLAKSPTYFYDADAIRETQADGTAERYDYSFTTTEGKTGLAPRDAAMSVKQTKQTDGQERFRFNPAGRNKRSVWTLGPESYAGAHFATMPTKLVEPCILAGSSTLCCAACGSPWERVVEQDGYVKAGHGGGTNKLANHVDLSATSSLRAEGMKRNMVATGWAATCVCQADVVPCTILDPFCGSGTVGFVSLRHGRNFIGIDLNANYLELARTRIEQSQPMLFSMGVDA